MKLFSKPCVRRYAHGLEFSEHIVHGGFLEPLSTLQLDTDVRPDRLKSPTVQAVTGQYPPNTFPLSDAVQSKADIAPVELADAAASAAQLEPSQNPGALSAQTEGQWIIQQARLLSQPQPSNSMTTNGSTQAQITEDD